MSPKHPTAPEHPTRDRGQLTLKDVSKSYGDRSVLDGVSLTVRPGEKAGVIGENGSGKSTLLRLIAGKETPDSGELAVRFPGSVGYLAQTLPQTLGLGPRDTVRDAIDAALAELRELERRISEAEAALSAQEPTEAELEAYGDLLAAYEQRDGYRADSRVDAALHGLGLVHLGRERALGTLSGGEQSRLALACVLAAAPELLLLDEPTNHLDSSAVGWLEDHLLAHRGTLVVITHDRAFLERITTVILEVDRDLRGVARYGDGWAAYRTAKAADRRRRVQEHQEWLADVARTEELVGAAGRRLNGSGRDPGEGFGKHRRSHEAKLSGQVRAARTRLDALLADPVPAPPRPLVFTGEPVLAGGTDTESPGEPAPVAELESVAVGDRLDLPFLRVTAGRRLLVTGPNGAGKTTLLRVLAGDLAPDTGTVRRRARIGYLPQELPARLTRRSLLSTFAAGRPGLPEEYEEDLLALGLFRADDLHVSVAALSVGQQRRLALARLVTRPADLLVLDEPTNHIALTLVEELEAALAAYRGAVVVVSHDRSFRGRFTGERLELREGRPVT
ncbi:ATP-binding cassette domain-containing protein [Streptomyces sp. NBC_00234]|uniref:ribosomal protection-like ABC-F family protein n=1 Tax=Streptomyces sp. NBC_00234 TaxID=2903638 RepID=UPI002E2CB8E8|nr:ABC-F family ATP-binding cassette domain-containing protein [Streptomyces sp. NBC_00234]